jgi:hypothetical protein
MKNSIPVKMFVLALSITNIFCFGQQNRSAVCQLGEIKNDSILPYIQALEINCASKDLEKYSKKSARLSSLKNIIFKGDASETEWTKVFKEIKSQPSIKQVAFIENTFESLPAGYENLFSIEQISFIGNDNLDYSTLIQQLSTLPNLTDLTMDIVTIFDVPTNLNDLKNIQHITLINSDESISKNETELFAVPKEPITYDYYLDKGDKKYAALKYTAAAGEIDSDEYKELSKRFATTLNFGDANTTFTPKYVNVNPPIKGIDVERTNYTLNPTIENIITYPSGTKILIPANSFTDKNGEPVSESVTLSYREFRDPVDFLVSGIPMKYDTGGTVTNFESAGMFEMTASIKNEPIKLAPDKKIDMNFASTSKDSTYNFYSFNDSAGNWNYLNKPKTVTSATKIKFRNPTRGFLQYQYLSQNPANIYDSTKFEERFESNKHLYTSIKDTANRYGLTYKKGGKDHHRALRSLVKISNVRKTKEGDVLFKVTYLDYAHPELREFNNMYFALNENMTTTEFRQKYVRRKYYNDVRVYTNGGDIDFKFKDSKSVNDISATMVVLDDKGHIKDAKDLSTRMKKYNRRLKSREREFDKKLAKGKIERNIIRITDQKQLSIYAFKTAQQYMTAEEKKMNYDEWLTYYKQVKTEQEQQILEQAKYTAESNKVQLAKLDVSAANAQNLVQSLSIGGMGIYNCDQIQRMKDPVKVFANYKTIDKNKLNPKAAYVIDKHANSVFQYDGYSGFNANKIAFDKDVKAENTLLAINEDGSIAVYSVDDFKKNDFRNRERFDFMVTKIDSKFTTVAELKTLIGF